MASAAVSAGIIPASSDNGRPPVPVHSTEAGSARADRDRTRRMRLAARPVAVVPGHRRHLALGGSQILSRRPSASPIRIPSPGIV